MSHQDINCIFDGLGCVGAIYLSNLQTAQNLHLLQKLYIGAVLTVGRSSISTKTRQGLQFYLQLEADDFEQFEESYKFIDAVRKTNNVLICCQTGISRSSTIAVAYLTKKYPYTLSKVYGLVKRRRRKINPNRGFIEQLNTYARKLNPNDPGIDQLGQELKSYRRSFIKNYEGSPRKLGLPYTFMNDQPANLKIRQTQRVQIQDTIHPKPQTDKNQTYDLSSLQFNLSQIRERAAEASRKVSVQEFLTPNLQKNLIINQVKLDSSDCIRSMSEVKSSILQRSDAFDINSVQNSAKAIKTHQFIQENVGFDITSRSQSTELKKSALKKGRSKSIVKKAVTFSTKDEQFVYPETPKRLSSISILLTENQELEAKNNFLGIKLNTFAGKIL